MAGTLLAVTMGVRALRIILLTAGVLGLVALVYLLDAQSIASALARITWWQFALVCVVHGISMAIDTVAWRYTLLGESPPFHKLLAAKCAGEAVNVLTALGAVGGEATKAWLLRREIPYEASVPSLILAKTSLVLSQALLLAVGIVVAWTTGIAGPTLLAAMGYLLLAEVIGIGGFMLVQNVGVVGKAGRILAWAGARVIHRAQRFDDALRGFYRNEWRAFLLSIGLHFVGWLIGILEALLILHSLGVAGSVITATVIDALGSGVRFATFFVPASLGTLEGANAAAFAAFGWAASAGLAFSLVRRARQAVWIGVGVAILLAMGVRRSSVSEPATPAPSGAD
ncbi:MAG: flippase-like domain-containing protein [Candidatus Rokuibacteriota bacterium]